MRVLARSVASVLMVLAVPAAAQGGTLYGSPGSYYAYIAAPGEVNTVRIDAKGDLTDETAPVTAGDSCGERCAPDHRLTIILGDGDDSLVIATESAPYIEAGEGDDSVVVTRSGGWPAGYVDSIPRPDSSADLHGGGGNDRITTEFAQPVLGEAGADDLTGVLFVHGGLGDDAIHLERHGPTVADELIGSKAPTYACSAIGKAATPPLGGATDGGPGNDVITGSTGRDFVEGGSGFDRIDGGDGADNLSEADVIAGGPGDDVINIEGSADGGPGDDSLRATPAIPLAQIAGGAGVDTLCWPGESRVERDLRGLGPDDAREVEVLMGSAGEDHFTLGARPFAVATQSGNDVIDGGPANDVILGGRGDDVIHGGAGDDVLDGGGQEEHKGDDKLDGGPGNDRLKGGWGDDELDGGPGADTLDGEQGANELRGGPGDDRLFANALNGFRLNHSPVIPLAFGERVHCDAGRDVVYSDYDDTVGPDCELGLRGTPNWSRVVLRSDGTLTLRARCRWSGDEPCRGRLIVSALADSPVPAGERAGLAPPKACPSRGGGALASGAYSVRAGRVGSVTVKLPPRSRALVARRHCVPALVVLSLRNPETDAIVQQSRTLRLVGRR